MTSAEERPPEPLTELRQLDEQPAPGFFGRVQRSVERRRLASETVDLSWTVVQVVFLEALHMVFEVFGRRRHDDKGGER